MTQTATLVSRSSRVAGGLVLDLVAWGSIAGATVAPHPMPYFNELAGRPEHGDDHLVDSNLDWGQDLLWFKRWLDRHPEARPFHLAY